MELGYRTPALGSRHTLATGGQHRHLHTRPSTLDMSQAHIQFVSPHPTRAHPRSVEMWGRTRQEPQLWAPYTHRLPAISAVFCTLGPATKNRSRHLRRLHMYTNSSMKTRSVQWLGMFCITMKHSRKPRRPQELGPGLGWLAQTDFSTFPGPCVVGEADVGPLGRRGSCSSLKS